MIERCVNLFHSCTRPWDAFDELNLTLQMKFYSGLNSWGLTRALSELGPRQLIKVHNALVSARLAS